MARYCPVGDGVFEDWVERCPECGRALRDEPPGEGAVVDENTGEIVWLMTVDNEPIAQMWAESLRGEGIPVMLRPGGPGVGAWGSVAVFEHHIYVRASDLPRAQSVIADLEGVDDGEAWDDTPAPPGS
jgi:hypothetical protein